MVDSTLVADVAGLGPEVLAEGLLRPVGHKAFSPLAPCDLGPQSWDYVVLTAADDAQARYFQEQLALRRRMGFLPEARHLLAVGDPPGRPLGSGGSTLWCWMQILGRELPPGDRGDPRAWHEVLARRRIFILHAGGQSRRLPAYRAGKCLLPLPGAQSLFDTLLDRQLAAYLALAPPRPGLGHTVIAAGDVLADFEPHEARLDAEGITGFGCWCPAEQASRHGVYCATASGAVARFLQKPSVAEQAALGCLNSRNEALLDVGLMHVDAGTAVRLLLAAGVKVGEAGRLGFAGPLGQLVPRLGLDWYREIACALGFRATRQSHAEAARTAGSPWPAETLAGWFDALAGTPCRVHCLSPGHFLHFGTCTDLLSSSAELARRRGIAVQPGTWLGAGNLLGSEGRVSGGPAWIEACRIHAPIILGGDNVLVAADVEQPARLPPGACLNLLEGRDPAGDPVFFVCLWGIRDDFKVAGPAATWCHRPLEQWVALLGLGIEDLWDPHLSPEERTLWNARVVPTARDAAAWTEWLWVFETTGPSDPQRAAFRDARRYSHAEVSRMAVPAALDVRRAKIAAARLAGGAGEALGRQSVLSAREITHLMELADSPAHCLAAALGAAYGMERDAGQAGGAPSLEHLALPRLWHTLADAVAAMPHSDEAASLVDRFAQLDAALEPHVAKWLKRRGLDVRLPLRQWSHRARQEAMGTLARAIVRSGARQTESASALRRDEIVWCRAPARLDLCGGWTDTPPYCLEHGGCVLNMAVDLNGQPPIQAFARVIEEPVVRITSIDRGTRQEIWQLDSLYDYGDLASEFSLAKGALALAGVVPPCRQAAAGQDLRRILERFGGGIELTTLAAVPKGSGLGTSSIMGAVLLAALDRVMGRAPEPQRLLDRVLRLEQLLGTGGGWQDQIGGITDGVKVITTQPGMTPSAVVEFLPGEMLDPASNGGQTLLYYTGITRVARNILARVVGKYLDRDPAVLAALARLRTLPAWGAAALVRRDLEALGKVIDAAWHWNKRLDPDSTTPEIEGLLDRVGPHIFGAKLLGAGGGGFLLLICRSRAAAQRVRALLQANPPNSQARFFNFSINHQGLQVTAC